MECEMRTLLRGFGERFRQDLPLTAPLPLNIALMLEHLRRAEDERTSPIR